MIEFDESSVGDYLGSCRFWVPGKPRGKARPRFNPAAPGARPYTPAATVAYETLVATRYRAERVEADLRMPHVTVSCRHKRMRPPESWKRARLARRMHFQPSRTMAICISDGRW